jgi:hypothetical protein
MTSNKPLTGNSHVKKGPGGSAGGYLMVRPKGIQQIWANQLCEYAKAI